MTTTGNSVFNALLREKADQFRAAFSTVSTEMFYDEELGRLRHTGEYGTFREAVVKDLLKFVIPRNLDISSGFVITPTDDISTQCDIVVFDTNRTPFYENNDRQRFFPVESVFCVIEVKSTLSKTGLGDALNKLSEVKKLGENLPHPSITDSARDSSFDPVYHAYDRVPTILVCNNLNFSRTDGLDGLENEIDELYDTETRPHNRHNMILSIDDGLLCYVDQNNRSLPYSQIKREGLRNRFIVPTHSNYSHFKFFAAYTYMITNNRTGLYPEISDYVGNFGSYSNRDETISD